ncbi:MULTISPECIES: PACE efflux transporter [Paraburkholderia]|uniref:PACE efflux transporter n=1 Tax=Paraburkholderia TaxID=1822464 RepID=UPI002254CAFD|nr:MULTISPECIES: PACE efflux transporter [Paraburkholderia]MCX4162778.1 PACE efflux transporter [Paraburkholderia megapolitana]MDN7158273.1 PACE efflux transporter [Paraburkholderia sp. CHISQ3]MDQ6495320.1 PACE efflux transporter [Paraburkholderia megapolitana]
MQGISRKIVQAFLYEAVAVFCISPAISLIYKEGLVHSGTLSIMISLIAVTWSMIYNAVFESWEARRARRTRTAWRRILHSTGFEGGLTFILLPLVSFWLKISWLDALMVNIGLFIFFFFYAFAFQWVFDWIFDVPDSAKEARQPLVKDR